MTTNSSVPQPSPPSTHLSIQFLSLLSGTLGALASTFAKGAFGQWVWKPSNVRLICATTDSCYLTVDLACRAACLLGMLVCNALMLGSFVKGMQERGSVAGTALSSAANFSVSAFIGWLLFREEFSSRWWLGFAMVLIGTILLFGIQAKEDEKVHKKD